MDGPSNIDAALTKADVDALFQTILRRECDNPQYARDLVNTGMTLRQFIVRLRASPELRFRMREEVRVHDETTRRNPIFYRCPQDLAVSPTPMRRVLLIGSCLMHFWEQALAGMGACATDLYLTGGELPEQPVRPVVEYDCQILHLPLRSILPDSSFARLGQGDIEGHEQLFAHSLAVTRDLLRLAMRWNLAYGLLTFVFPFVVPQQNPVGRLLPRYDLRNPVFFIEKLNEALSAELLNYRNAFFFDLNEILSSHGRRFVQEDLITQFNHGAFLTDFDFPHDAGRLEPPQRATEVYEERIGPIITAAWHDLMAMIRTLRQIDMVKLVVIDLDDTLWRGVVAEVGLDELPTAEGWPRGFWEALQLLKRRGVLLAIASQNDEARVLEAWEAIFGHHQIRLDDFAARRIDWRPKATKIAEILDQVNLLPRNVIFIDDNPLQRSEVAAAFPEIRVLGGDPFTWRHILLWAPETQVVSITAESEARTQMVQAQVVREASRDGQSREEFLAGLQVQMLWIEVSEVTHPRFARVLELINKTNQFNTTGRRWTAANCAAAFAEGTRIHAFELSDRYTTYGLVGVLILNDGGIRQFVMSCRIMGLDAELAAVAHAVALLRQRGRRRIVARMVETERNLPCRNVFERCGFSKSGNGSWHYVDPAVRAAPGHISVAPPTDDA